MKPNTFALPQWRESLLVHSGGVMTTQTIKLNVKPAWKVGRGHAAYKSGAGVHQDRRTKRYRTRRAQVAAALKEY